MGGNFSYILEISWINTYVIGKFETVLSKCQKNYKSDSSEKILGYLNVQLILGIIWENWDSEIVRKF